MTEKRLVVIGAGNAGTCLVNDIAAVENLKVTVIERKDHFDMTIGQPRCMVNGSFASEALWSWSDVLNGSPEVVLVKEVVSISDGSVKILLANGQSSEIPADAIVIATGSRYRSEWIKNNDCLPKTQWLAKMDQCRQAMTKAGRVLIIGGGITGVELAGEIVTEYPEVKVTVVHKGSELLNSGEGMHQATMAASEVVPGDIEFICNDTVDAQETLSAGRKTYTTASGKQIEDVDVVINCVGVSPNTDFIPADKLNERGFIEVEESLIAPKLSSSSCPVFAIGDCTPQGGFRAVAARFMGQALAKNITAWAKGETFDGSVYKPSSLPIVASLGRTEGMANLPWANRWLARLFKCPTMFQVDSIGLMHMEKLKEFKMSPEALAGPNDKAQEQHNEKMGWFWNWMT